MGEEGERAEAMTTCTRKLHWCAGHRVMGHEGKCAMMHGHEYMAELTVRAASLDELGRVIDFGVLKSLMQAWVDEHLDHGFMLNSIDTAAQSALHSFEQLSGINQRLYLMDANPTAENIARELHSIASRLLQPHSIEVVSVVVHETPNCYATYQRGM